MTKRIFSVFFSLLLFSNLAYSQTTGKISGRIIDAASKEALPGANVIVDGTNRGAASDAKGNFFIINLPPATYKLRVQMIGYETVIVEQVRVSVNRTAAINVEMKEAAVMGEEVVVTASKVSIKKDQTASIKNISSEQISSLPVESVTDVIEMQAGVVAGHFRGGRLTEVSYLVDGMQVDEAFSGERSTIELETEVVQDLEVITGTFNAEYGRALSGVVNGITKDGGKEFHGSFQGFVSNYLTPNNDVFIGLKNSDFTRNQDYKVQLDGPIIGSKLTFFANYRYQDIQGHLNGINRFNVDDFTNFLTPVLEPTAPDTPWDFYDQDVRYYSEARGDSSFVPMNTTKRGAFFGKLTFAPVSSFKLSLLYTRIDEQGKGYNHGNKYTPMASATNYRDSNFYLLQLNHLLSANMFYDLKLSLNDAWNRSYLFKDPLDPRYVSDIYDRGNAGFRTGGQERHHTDVFTKNYNAKFDITWQAHRQHSLKAGFLYTQHELKNKPIIVRNSQEGESGADATQGRYDFDQERIIFGPYLPEIVDDSSVEVDRYKKEPYEFSAYFQDKMEFDALVLNLGLRYDYFNPNTTYPSQLRNPANQLLFPDNPERVSTYPEADPKVQISPRFGLSYRVGQAAVIRFSYGHFFQMPPLYALFQNSGFLVPPGDFRIVHGNPQIKAERTVQYEMGVWQEIVPNMGLELSVYYRDIYDLQSAIVVTTYNQIKYGVFSNKDYGNVKGLEVKYDWLLAPFSIFMNYTWQFTRGNADNPTSSFSRLGQSRDPITSLITLAWDQRHTFNVTVGYNQPDYGVNLTAFYNSGLPFSFVPISESPLSKQPLLPNNARRPSNYQLDLKAHYDYPIWGGRKVRFSLSAYNLLDRLNELSVNPTTGRAYTTILSPTALATFRSNFNDILDAAQNPGMFAAPREIKLGVGFQF